MNRFFLSILPILTKICVTLAFIFLCISFVYIHYSPIDYQQGLLIKILYLHVPCAWLSLLCYACMAICALGVLIANNFICAAALKVMEPIGANFTALTLICGSLWGAKSWGTWWAWDARLVSELLLLFIYLAMIALRKNFTEQTTADFSCSILCLLGSINLPIIKFSIKWWNSLHQDATISWNNTNNIDPLMLKALLSSSLALLFFMLVIFLIKLKLELLMRATNLRSMRLIRLNYKNNIKETKNGY